MHDVGEKPGIGTYCCTSCNWKVHLDDNSDRLPPAEAAERASTPHT
jgi:hypothetical protein